MFYDRTANFAVFSVSIQIGLGKFVDVSQHYSWDLAGDVTFDGAVAQECIYRVYSNKRLGAYSTQAGQGVGANEREALIWDRR